MRRYLGIPIFEMFVIAVILFAGIMAAVLSLLRR
jgi:hypothetical protein